MQDPSSRNLRAQCSFCLSRFRNLSKLPVMNSASRQPLISARAVDCSQIADWSRQVGWDIEYQQVGRGNFDAWFCAGSCQELRLTNQMCNREMVICGGPPHDMIAVVLPSGRGHLGVYEGKTLRRNDAVVLCPGDGRVLCSPAGFQTCTISMPWSRLEAALSHYAGRDLPAVLPKSRTFSLPQRRHYELAATSCSLTSSEDPGQVESAASG